MKSSSPISPFDLSLATPLGGIGIHCSDSVVEQTVFLGDVTLPKSSKNAQKSALLDEITWQIRAYFNDPHFQFDLPLLPAKSAFMQSVRELLCAIPTGSTRRYGDLAQLISSSARAIGTACRLNPYPLIVPCHRVVAQASLGGFMGVREGFQMDLKKWLLNHEQAI